MPPLRSISGYEPELISGALPVPSYNDNKMKGLLVDFVTVCVFWQVQK